MQVRRIDLRTQLKEEARKRRQEEEREEGQPLAKRTRYDRMGLRYTTACSCSLEMASFPGSTAQYFSHMVKYPLIFLCAKKGLSLGTWLRLE